MASKTKPNRQHRAMAGAQPTAAKPRPEHRDFGLLKVRQMRVKQATKIIHGQTSRREETTRFDRMDNERLLQILNGTDFAQIRELSRYFEKTNGIYARAIRYMADLLRYDNMIYPNLNLETKQLTPEQSTQILKKFNAVLEHFDNSAIQHMCRKWAAQVCRDGVYYGYIVEDISDKVVIQDLPIEYCRSRFLHRGKPIIEFRATYFDKVTNDEDQRKQILALFPPEFQAGYQKYKNQKLTPEFQGDEDGWFILDLQRAFKFNLCSSDLPPFLYAIPALIERTEIKDLAKEKLLQELQKILVQEFKLDKNGQIPFSMTELQKLNQNAVDMVGDAVGVSVLTTVGEVHIEDMHAEGGQEATKKVNAAEDDVYKEMGISTNLFNTSGNLALEKSVATDEAFMKPLLLQFEEFFNAYIEWKFNKPQSKFRMKILGTSIFNHRDMSDAYRQLTTIGFSRFLPMIALGHTQKEVASLARTEQQVMQLDNWMLPPFSSNTMSSDTWQDIKQIQQKGGLNEDGAPVDPEAPDAPVEGDEGGRPPLPQEDLSDKTIANQASQ